MVKTHPSLVARSYRDIWRYLESISPTESNGIISLNSEGHTEKVRGQLAGVDTVEPGVGV